MKNVGFCGGLVMNKKGKIICFLFFEVLVLVFYFVAGRWAKEEGRRNTIDNYIAVHDFNYLFKIEEVNNVEEKVNISGWICYPETRNKDVALVLSEVGSNKEEIFWGDLVKRKDVIDQFFLKSNDQNIGFDVDIDAEKLSSGICYEIYIALTYEGKMGDKILKKEEKVKTQKFFFDGELFNYNPLEFQKPEVSDEDMIKVVEDGIVLSYNYECGIWIYQYDCSLYFVVDSRKNSFAEDTDIVIPIMLRTSRTELFPDGNQQDKRIHLGAYHAEEKYCKEEVMPYEVLKIELPQDYPITYVETGLYDDVQKEWAQKIVLPLFQ